MLSEIIIPVLSLIAIFLFGVQKFSKQIHQAADEGFGRLLRTATSTRLRGLLLGTTFTSIIQSSTATTVILASLVSAGMLPFENSLGVIFGANIGTTVTSQLIAFHIPNVAPYLILLGFIITYVGRSHQTLGKAIFYFGLIFFSLSLISLYLEPIKGNPEALSLFSNVSSIYGAMLIGAFFTAVIQSSSVTAGLTIVLAGSGLLNLEQAIGLVIGANLGTTTTTLLASLTMHVGARRVAMAHFLFNLIGIVLFLPIIGGYVMFIANLGGPIEQQIANAHIIFNISCAALFMIFTKPFFRLMNFIVP